MGEGAARAQSVQLHRRDLGLCPGGWSERGRRGRRRGQGARARAATSRSTASAAARYFCIRSRTVSPNDGLSAISFDRSAIDRSISSLAVACSPHAVVRSAIMSSTDIFSKIVSSMYSSCATRSTSVRLAKNASCALTRSTTSFARNAILPASDAKEGCPKYGTICFAAQKPMLLMTDASRALAMLDKGALSVSRSRSPSKRDIAGSSFIPPSALHCVIANELISSSPLLKRSSSPARSPGASWPRP